MRYPGAFLGRLVESYLGRPGSFPVSAVLALSSFLGVAAFYVGFGATLDGATSVPAAVWVAALFLVSAYYVRRGSLDATVATAIAVGAVNLCVVLVLAGLAFAHLEPSNLTHAEIPFVHAGGLESSAIGVVFGVVLMAYFGHLSAVTCGSVVLERDPGGRSLVTGCASAQATAFAIYSVFVLATTGAVGAQNLTGVNGTVITPLAEVAGAGVAILGSVYVILGLGMGSLFDALSLSWLVRERLPSTAPRLVVLPKGRARLVFRSRRDRLRVGLAYLGPTAGGARFSLDVERRGVLEQTTLVVAGQRDVLPPDGRDRLTLEVLESDDRAARIATASTLRIAYEGELDGAGLDLAEALTLSDAEAALAASLVRSGEASLTLAAERVGRSEQETLVILEALAARGIVEERPTPEGPRFFAHIAPRRARSSSVWETIVDDESSQGPSATSPGQGERTAPGPRFVLGHFGRFLVSLVPLTAAFVLAEWLVISGVGSFAGLLSFLGVIVVSLLAGLYPILLLVASRRKGEYAFEGSRRLLGRPVLLVSIYLLFLAVPVAHAAVIWDSPAERVGALAAAVAMLVIPVVLFRSGSFKSRLTIEVRDDQRSGTARFAFLAGERPVTGSATLRYPDSERCPDVLEGEIPEFDSLERAVFEVRAGETARPDDVKVWAHRVTPEGESESLPARAMVRGGDRGDTTDLSLSRGETVVPFADAVLEVHIVLRESAEHPT